MLVEVMYCLFELCNLCLYDLKTFMFAINLHVLKFTSCSNLVNCQFFNAFMSVCVCDMYILMFGLILELGKGEFCLVT